MIAFTTTPLIITLAVLSNELIAIILGDQWLQASPVYRFLAIAAIGAPIQSAAGWVSISLGQTDRMRNCVMITTPIIVLSFVIGLPWGAIGVALSYAVFAHIVRYPVLAYLLGKSPLCVRHVMNATWRPTVISLIMCASMGIARYYLLFATDIWIVLSTTLIGALAFCSMTWCWPNARMQVLDILRSVLGSGPSSRSRIK